MKPLKYITNRLLQIILYPLGIVTLPIWRPILALIGFVRVDYRDYDKWDL